MKILTERRYSFTTTAEREIGRDVKEKLTSRLITTQSSNRQRKSSDKNQTYMLSDGNIITVGPERVRYTSVFPASFIGIKASGVHDTSFHYFTKCDVDLRRICMP